MELMDIYEMDRTVDFILRRRCHSSNTKRNKNFCVCTLHDA
ncbi:hypothetical protein OIU76_026362 [Salix suchowensis]|nr:hypothetical protein OIU76_026362 [Salix suchowensis]